MNSKKNFNMHFFANNVKLFLLYFDHILFVMHLIMTVSHFSIGLLLF